MSGPNVKIKFLSEEAKKFGLPKYAYTGDAGFDLRVILKDGELKDGFTTIYPGDRALLSCGMAIQMEAGYWGRITHRSSTERRLRLRVVEGTIDNGFTGELFTQVHNPNTFPIEIKHGDRIAQLIFQKLEQGEFVEVEQFETTDRGASGFGSSGKA
jgi:dUTP pyrophosphatase